MPSKKERSLESLQSNYKNKVNRDSLYSLDVDPTNTYKFDITTKEFISLMIEYDDIYYVCKVLKITLEHGMSLLFRDDVKVEIMRIKTAAYHKKFANRMLTFDEIGGYLTSLIMDKTFQGEKVSMKQKLEIAKILIDLNERKNKAKSDNTTIEVIPEDVNNQVKELSVDDIKKLLNKKSDSKQKKPKTKRQLINEIKAMNVLSKEELDGIELLSEEELQEIINGGV